MCVYTVFIILENAMALLPGNLNWTKKLDLKQFGIEKINEYKHKCSNKQTLDKGYKFFAEQYIYNVQTALNSDGKVFVRAKCYASQKKKDNHSLHVVLSYDTGSVQQGHCVCKAG